MATFFIGGPDRPPVVLLSVGLPVVMSISMAGMVLMAVIPSAPAFIATSADSIMVWDIFTNTGTSVEDFVVFTISDVNAVSSPTSSPKPTTQGQDRLISKAVAIPSNISIMDAKSAGSYPARLTMTGYEGRPNRLANCFAPMFFSPMALSQPPFFFFTRFGSAWPSRGCIVIDLVTTAPIPVSYACFRLSGVSPRRPDASMTGLRNSSGPIRVVVVIVCGIMCVVCVY